MKTIRKNLLETLCFVTISSFFLNTQAGNSMNEFNYRANELTNNLQDNDISKHEPYKLENRKLRIEGAGEGIGWFSDSQGPLLYKNIEGDFLIETEVEIKRKDGKPGLPKGQFNSAGLLIRDSSSTYGNESWVMYNIGFQNRFYGTEVKVTRPLGDNKDKNNFYDQGFHSLSTLILIPAENAGPAKLRIVRIGNEIRFYHQIKGKWMEQPTQGDIEVDGNGTQIPVQQFDAKKGKLRPNALALPQKLQAGLIVNPGIIINNNSQDNDSPQIQDGRDGYALFSYFKARRIASFEEALL